MNLKSTRANHSYKLYVKGGKVNAYKYSFSTRIIKSWNNLPSKVVDAGRLSTFKKKLTAHLGI